MHLSKHHRGCRCIIRLILRHFVSFLTLYFLLLYFIFGYIFQLEWEIYFIKEFSDRIGILYQNSDRIWIRQFRIGFWTLGNCRITNVQSDPMHTSSNNALSDIQGPMLTNGSFQKRSIPPPRRKFLLSEEGREEKCLRMSEGGEEMWI
jgi:hypothetical protein